MTDDKNAQEEFTEPLIEEELFDSVESAKDFDILEHVLSSSFGTGIIGGVPHDKRDSVISEVEELTAGYQNIFDFFQKALSDPDTRDKFLEVARQKFNG